MPGSRHVISQPTAANGESGTSVLVEMGFRGCGRLNRNVGRHVGPLAQWALGAPKPIGGTGEMIGGGNFG
jgi:hypothetical protein